MRWTFGQLLAPVYEFLLVVILFAGDVLVKLCCLPVAYFRGIFPTLAVAAGCFLFFLDTFAKIAPDAGFLDIVSRQIVVFLYLAASAFFTG